MTREVNGRRSVKEARRPTDLLQICLPEGLVYDQVEHGLLYVIVLIDKLVVQVDGLTCLGRDFDLHIFTSEIDLPID